VSSATPLASANAAVVSSVGSDTASVKQNKAKAPKPLISPRSR
jgi:hypothetical protein